MSRKPRTDKLAAMPLSKLKWVKAVDLFANDYNPNKVFRPELALLKTSILEDGWTQPIVIRPSGQIIDGFHRWTLASTDEDVAALTDGLVPVVVVEQQSEGKLMASTVRHNRARGQHAILKMADIVRKCVEDGMTPEEVCEHMGMEMEEFERLHDFKSSPDKSGKDSFGRGWVPL